MDKPNEPISQERMMQTEVLEPGWVTITPQMAAELLAGRSPWVDEEDDAP
jgi:hypothetical protein